MPTHRGENLGNLASLRADPHSSRRAWEEWRSAEGSRDAGDGGTSMAEADG